MRMCPDQLVLVQLPECRASARASCEHSRWSARLSARARLTQDARRARAPLRLADPQLWAQAALHRLSRRHVQLQGQGRAAEPVEGLPDPDAAVVRAAAAPAHRRRRRRRRRRQLARLPRARARQRQVLCERARRRARRVAARGRRRDGGLLRLERQARGHAGHGAQHAQSADAARADALQARAGRAAQLRRHAARGVLALLRDRPRVGGGARGSHLGCPLCTIDDAARHRVDEIRRAQDAGAQLHDALPQPRRAAGGGELDGARAAAAAARAGRLRLLHGARAGHDAPHSD
eukprot:6207422-Pleurochrysis_carterae.AAC.4